MKNNPVRYRLLTLVLIPMLLFNIGVQTFHNCNNLIHHHDEASLDIGHDKCLICEVKQHPFEENTLTEPVRICPAFSIEYAELIPAITRLSIPGSDTRGPPSSI